MGVEKRLLWIMAVFFVFIFVFSAVFPGELGNIARAYEPAFGGEGTEPAVDGNGIESAVDEDGIELGAQINAKVQPADPIGFLTTGTAGIVGAGGALEITVYEQDLALVKELREFELESGINLVEYDNVAARIDPASVMVEDPDNEDTAVIEQNYEYDLVSSFSLLENYLGREISVTAGDGESYSGKLLSYEGNSVVLEGADGNVLLLQNILKVEVPDASGLSTKPTLFWQLYSPVSGTRELLTSYLTGGISWNADYALISNADDTRADIRGWVSIDNRAGIDFEDAGLKLVSGEFNRVSTPQPVYEAVEEELVAEEAPMEEPFTEESFFEYHLYTLEKPTTLKNNQEKQISLFTADSVPIEKELIYDSFSGDRVRVFLTLDNSKENGLGMPLPGGVFRIYKSDSAGDLQFLGEDRIEHTPENGEIRAAVGTSFDVTASRTETDYERVSDNVERVSYEIELTNSKAQSQDVTIVEHLFGQWEILESSDEYEKIDAFTIEFRVTVPADGTKTVSYRVERRF